MAWYQVLRIHSNTHNIAASAPRTDTNGACFCVVPGAGSGGVRGNAGEYYTPRAITQFMVDMVDPKLGEKILDPACGTGGFLTCAINNIRKNYVKSIEDEEKLQKSISGVEKKPLPHLLCVTNMLLHGIEVQFPGIIQDARDR